MKLFEKMNKCPPDVHVTYEGRSIATESYILRVIQKELKKLRERKDLTRCTECGKLKE